MATVTYAMRAAFKAQAVELLDIAAELIDEVFRLEHAVEMMEVTGDATGDTDLLRLRIQVLRGEARIKADAASELLNRADAINEDNEVTP